MKKRPLFHTTYCKYIVWIWLLNSNKYMFIYFLNSDYPSLFFQSESYKLLKLFINGNFKKNILFANRSVQSIIRVAFIWHLCTRGVWIKCYKFVNIRLLLNDSSTRWKNKNQIYAKNIHSCIRLLIKITPAHIIYFYDPSMGIIHSIIIPFGQIVILLNKIKSQRALLFVS